MQFKRLLNGFILILSISLCLELGEANEEVQSIQTEAIKQTVEEVVTTEPSEVVQSETVVVEKAEPVTKKVTVDVEEVSQPQEAVVIEEEPEVEIQREVVVEGDGKKFHGKEIEKVVESHESHEIFEDDGILIKRSDVEWDEESIEVLGDEYEETKEVSSIEDEDRWGEGTLGELLSEILLDPLDSLLELVKQTLRSVLVSLDDILAEVFEFLGKLVNLVLVIVISIPLTLIDLLADIIPGVLGSAFTELDTGMDECVDHLKMDPVNKTFVELEQCITDPLFNIVEDLVEIVTDVQQILGEINQGLLELERARKAQDALAQVLAIVADVVEGVLEIVSDIVAGPLADLLILLPVLIACIVGDIGKNLIGGLLSLFKEYIDCYTDLI